LAISARLRREEKKKKSFWALGLLAVAEGEDQRGADGLSGLFLQRGMGGREEDFRTAADYGKGNFRDFAKDLNGIVAPYEGR